MNHVSLNEPLIYMSSKLIIFNMQKQKQTNKIKNKLHNLRFTKDYLEIYIWDTEKSNQLIVDIVKDDSPNDRVK